MVNYLPVPILNLLYGLLYIDIVPFFICLLYIPSIYTLYIFLLSHSLNHIINQADPLLLSPLAIQFAHKKTGLKVVKIDEVIPINSILSAWFKME